MEYMWRQREQNWEVCGGNGEEEEAETSGRMPSVVEPPALTRLRSL